MTYKFFESDESLEDYVITELIASLEDDYRLMCTTEKEHYDDDDRKVMAAKIHDIKLWHSRKTQDFAICECGRKTEDCSTHDDPESEDHQDR